MLILTRKVDECFVIAGNISVRVLHIGKNRVKIGIEAPAEILVLREELLEDGQGERLLKEALSSLPR